MSLFRIQLELARSKEAPEGDAGHGYLFVAPLDANGHLDAGEWKSHRSRCTVESFKRGAAHQKGHLVHVGQGWHFDYDAGKRDDDELLYKLDRHLIKQGEYLSVTEHDGVLRTFKIASVTAV